MPLYSNSSPLPINRKIFRHKGGAPVIWKVAIFGAGSIAADSEYVWDGVTTYYGKPTYYGQVYRIQFDYNAWVIYDSDNDTNLYISDDLITWTVANGDSPPPSSALSYSQGSYIQTVVLAGGTPDQSGTYTWDGTTFVNGKPKYFGPLKSGATENNYIFWNGVDSYSLYGWKVDEMLNLSYSTDLASYWNPSDAPGEPTVSSIVYTA